MILLSLLTPSTRSATVFPNWFFIAVLVMPVFDHIMQHGSHQRLMVHVHLDQYSGDRQRMGHIRFAAPAELPFMSLLGVVVRSSDTVDLVDLQIVRQIAGQRVDAFRNWGLYVSTPVAEGG